MKKNIIFVITIILFIITSLVFMKRRIKLCVTIMDTSCDSLHIDVLVDKENIYNNYVENEWYKYKEIDFVSNFGKHDFIIKVDDSILVDTSLFFLFNDNISIQFFSENNCKSITYSLINERMKTPLFD